MGRAKEDGPEAAGPDSGRPIKGAVLGSGGREIFEEPDPEAWAVPDGVLGSGPLERSSPTERRGEVTFLARGTRLAVLTYTGQINNRWTATMRIGRDKCAMEYFPATLDEPADWHGVISVEGYAMTARFDPAKGVLRLLDRKQPMHVDRHVQTTSEGRHVTPSI